MDLLLCNDGKPELKQLNLQVSRLSEGELRLTTDWTPRCMLILSVPQYQRLYELGVRHVTLIIGDHELRLGLLDLQTDERVMKVAPEYFIINYTCFMAEQERDSVQFTMRKGSSTIFHAGLQREMTAAE